MLSEGGIHNILSFKTTGLLIPLGKTVLNGTLLQLHPLKALATIQDPGCSSTLAILQLLCATGNLKGWGNNSTGQTANWPTAYNKRGGFHRLSAPPPVINTCLCNVNLGPYLMWSPKSGAQAELMQICWHSCCLLWYESINVLCLLT